MKRQLHRKKHWRILLHAAYILAIICGVYYISDNYFQLLLIQGDSMSPAYHNMQLTVLDRRTKEYTYGDVVAFSCGQLDAVLVKRVAAVPGDTVLIEEGILYVNGEISTVYPEEAVFQYAGTAAEPLMLAEDEYFMIGDNIAESRDSRYEDVGVINADSIMGKLI